MNVKNIILLVYNVHILYQSDDLTKLDLRESVFQGLSSFAPFGNKFLCSMLSIIAYYGINFSQDFVHILLNYQIKKIL